MALRFFGTRSVMLGVGTLAAVVAAMAGAAAPAHAALGIACPYPTSPVFLHWGDGHAYALAPGGDFETGAVGWTLSGGARVVRGNESFNVGGTGQTHSLSLPAGSSATLTADVRFALLGRDAPFTSNTGKATSKLRVQVIYGGGAGALLGWLGATLGISDAGTLTSTGTWQPSSSIADAGRYGAAPDERRPVPVHAPRHAAETGASTTSTSTR